MIQDSKAIIVKYKSSEIPVKIMLIHGETPKKGKRKRDASLYAGRKKRKRQELSCYGIMQKESH